MQGKIVIDRMCKAKYSPQNQSFIALYNQEGSSEKEHDLLQLSHIQSHFQIYIIKT